MGGSQSARTLTINNEDGVIQISTDLVERLTHGNKNTSTASSVADDTGDSRRTESSGIDDSQQTITHPVETRRVSSPSAVPNQPDPQAYPEYTITAYKIQQQKEMELEAQDRYWQKRLFNLKLQHEKINKVFHDEYKRAVDEISNAQGKKPLILIQSCHRAARTKLRC